MTKMTATRPVKIVPVNPSNPDAPLPKPTRAAKPTRVKPAVVAATSAADAAPADTFTTVSLAREYNKSPKTLRAFVRRHIDALKPMMTAPHTFPTARRADVIAVLKLA